MNRTPSEQNIKKAEALTKREAEFLIMRMGGKLGRRLDDHKLSLLEALAIQLEIEDERLSEWREKFAAVKARYARL